ncbi:MAG: RluA family pseudouridine synthase [Dehalococcoidia bacterium]|nr:RluA family pseudouridine synthase [Dehalococcoidia bacterium]
MNDRVEYPIETGGERLDVFLADRRSDLSRSRIRKLVDDGHVTVDGRPGKASTRLAAGQRVTLELPQSSPVELRPWNTPLSVLFEDEDLIVIDKPAGMTVHPAPGNEDHTLANAVLAHAPDIEGIGGERRPGIVHRLDKDTSGLIVVAKNGRAHAHLSDQFKSREVSKVYLALVVGHPSPPEADIDAPIGRHPHDRQRMAIVSTGRPAITRYRAVTSYSRSTLVEARPRTGRTHQIRVHLSSVGHPVVADTTYGRPAEGLSRQFLHAFRLGFIHPASGETVRFSAELPCDLRSHLDRLVPA